MLLCVIFFLILLHGASSSKEVPSEPRGVVLFYHIPKTAGSSFRDTMMANDFLYVTARKHDDVIKLLHDLKYKTNFYHRFVLAEIRPLALKPYLHKFVEVRDILRAAGIPVISLTIFRNPIDTVLSLYNYVCGPNSAQKRICNGDHSANNMVSWIQNDFQCSNVIHGFSGGGRDTITKANVEQNVSEKECLELLMTGFDLVASTSRFNETLRRIGLSLGINIDNQVLSSNSVFSKLPDTITKANLSHSHIESLNRSQNIDCHVYESIRASEDSKNDSFFESFFFPNDSKSKLLTQSYHTYLNMLKEKTVGGGCLTDGHYELGNLSKPYSDRWGGCSKRFEKWADWEWVSTYQERTDCSKMVADIRLLGRREGASVCEIFGNRSILFVGDSLSYQQWESLVYSSGYEDAMVGNVAQRNTRIKMSPVVSLCNNGEGSNAKAVYIRNDYLTDPPNLSEKCSYCFPFWKHIINFDVVVFNRGAHMLPTDSVKAQTIEFSKRLRALLDSNSDVKSPKLYWRTTVPGHSNCGFFTSPGERRDGVEMDYKWHLIPEQNRVIFEILNNEITELRIIDAERMTSDRRDRHNSHNDCLHYCVPGPIDWWNQVLLHSLSD